jgi:hypothetical protein
MSNRFRPVASRPTTVSKEGLPPRPMSLRPRRGRATRLEPPPSRWTGRPDSVGIGRRSVPQCAHPRNTSANRDRALEDFFRGRKGFAKRRGWWEGSERDRGQACPRIEKLAISTKALLWKGRGRPRRKSVGNAGLPWKRVHRSVMIETDPGEFANCSPRRTDAAHGMQPCCGSTGWTARGPKRRDRAIETTDEKTADDGAKQNAFVR